MFREHSPKEQMLVIPVRSVVWEYKDSSRLALNLLGEALSSIFSADDPVMVLASMRRYQP